MVPRYSKHCTPGVSELWPGRWNCFLIAHEHQGYVGVEFALVNASMADADAVDLLREAGRPVEPNERWAMAETRDTFSTAQVEELARFLKEHEPRWRFGCRMATLPGSCHEVECASATEWHVDGVKWLLFDKAQSLGLSFRFHGVAYLPDYKTAKEVRFEESERRRERAAACAAGGDGIPY